MNQYIKTNMSLFGLKVRHEMKKIKSELNQHRHYLEQNVVRRTELLVKRIELLEACNASLCSKLALTQAQLAALKPATLPSISATEREAKLYLVNTRIKSAVQKHA